MEHLLVAASVDRGMRNLILISKLSSKNEN